MSRLESSAEFARILLSDFEAAEKVCDSNSDAHLTKHEMIIRRLNTHIEMDRQSVAEIIGDMRAKYVREQNESLMKIGKNAIEGSLFAPLAAPRLERSYREVQAKVSVLDELLEKIEGEA